ncbi:hypothetical protein HT031_005990 [Scenedesmus sp. PABB004]|nr:hypothetical protein HT031_005990 [Scenedesmus sp. PABB004]
MQQPAGGEAAGAGGAGAALVPFRLVTDRPPLAAGLGPPDFFPLVPGSCPEDRVDAASLGSGYTWLPEALKISEANEALLSLTGHDEAFWERHNVDMLRQCVHARLCAVFRQREAARAGGGGGGGGGGGAAAAPPRDDAGRGGAAAPPPRLCAASEQERAGWLLDLASTCPLADLAGRVPDSIEREGLFELLVRYHVPLPRAAWLVQAVYWLKPPSPAAAAAAPGGSGAAAAGSAGGAAPAAAGGAAGGAAGAAGGAGPARSAATAGGEGGALQQARLQHWTQTVLQQLERYAAAAAAARGAAATAAAAAAAAATAAAAAAAVAASLDVEPTPAAVAAATAASDGASAAAARAASADAAAAGAVQAWQAALRLAAWCCEGGLLELERLVAWAERQLGGTGSAVEELREGALLLAKAGLNVRRAPSVALRCLPGGRVARGAPLTRLPAAAPRPAQGIGGCHSLALRLARCLLAHLEGLEAAPAQLLGQQPSKRQRTSSSGNLAAAGSGALPGGDAPAAADVAAPAAPAADPRQQQQQREAVQLLRQLFLLAPASFVALDTLPQLCHALLGPAAARALLAHSGGARACAWPAQGGLDAEPELVACLGAVLDTARHMAAAVSPRLLSFSVPAAVAQLSRCCLVGDVNSALAVLSPTLKGFLPADTEAGFASAVGLVLDWACAAPGDALRCLPLHLLPSGPQAQPDAGGGAGGGPPLPLEAAPDAAARRLFACRLLVKLRDRYAQRRGERQPPPAPQQQGGGQAAQDAPPRAGAAGAARKAPPASQHGKAPQLQQQAKAGPARPQAGGTAGGKAGGAGAAPAPHGAAGGARAAAAVAPRSRCSPSSLRAAVVRGRRGGRRRRAGARAAGASRGQAVAAVGGGGAAAAQAPERRDAGAGVGKARAGAGGRAKLRGADGAGAGGDGHYTSVCSLLGQCWASKARPAALLALQFTCSSCAAAAPGHTLAGRDSGCRRPRRPPARQAYAAGRRAMLDVAAAAAQDGERALPLGFEPPSPAKRRRLSASGAALGAAAGAGAEAGTAEAGGEAGHAPRLQEVQAAAFSWLGLGAAASDAAADGSAAPLVRRGGGSCWDAHAGGAQDGALANGAASPPPARRPAPQRLQPAGLQAAAAGLRPWERAVLAQQLACAGATALGLGLAPAGAAADAPPGQAAGPALTARAWLAGPCAGLWLQRLVALLVAADAAGDAVVLLLQLLDRHVKAAVHAASQGLSGQAQQGAGGFKVPAPHPPAQPGERVARRSGDGRGEAAGAGGSGGGGAAVPVGCVLALLEGLQDVIAAAGLMPLLLETCVGWAMPPAAAAAAGGQPGAQPPHKPGGAGGAGGPQDAAAAHRLAEQLARVALRARPHLGACIAAAGRLTAGRFNTPCVKSWWEGLQARAGGADAPPAGLPAGLGGPGGGAAAPGPGVGANGARHWLIVQLTAAAAHYGSAAAAKAGGGADGGESEAGGLIGSGVLRVGGVCGVAPAAAAAAVAAAAARASAGGEAGGGADAAASGQQLLAQLLGDGVAAAAGAGGGGPAAGADAQRRLAGECAAAAAALARELAATSAASARAPGGARGPAAALQPLTAVCGAALRSFAAAASVAGPAPGEDGGAAQLRAGCLVTVLQGLHARLLAGAAAAGGGGAAFGAGVDAGLSRCLLDAARQALAEPSASAAARQCVLDGVMCAAAAGLVLLPDVAAELLAAQHFGSGAGQLSPELRPSLLWGVLGAGCWQQPAPSAAADGGGAPGPAAGGLDAGLGSTLARLQAALPPESAMALLQAPLLAAVVSGLQPAGDAGSAAAARPQPGAAAAQQATPALTDAVAALVGHAPLRACVLTDVRLAYAKLAAASPSLLVALLAGAARPGFWALPQRLAVQSLLLGRLLVMAPGGEAAHAPALAPVPAQGGGGGGGGAPAEPRLRACLAVPRLSAAVLAAARGAVGANLSPAAAPYLLAQLELLAGLRGALGHELPWLLLRLLLDEQMAMEALDNALARGGGPGGGSWLAALEAAAPLMPGGGAGAGARPLAAAPLAGAGPHAGSASAAAAVLVSHTERNLVDTLLLALGRAPGAGLAAAELVSDVAGGASQYLLQRVDWLLQDRGGTWLAGSASLSQLLARLEPAQVVAAAEAAAAAEQPGGASGGAPPPFAVEAALSDVVLLLLARSSHSRQREFAAELVRQLGRVVELLRRAPPLADDAGKPAAAPGAAAPGAAAPGPAPAAQPAEAVGGGSGGGGGGEGGAAVSTPPIAPPPPGDAGAGVAAGAKQRRFGAAITGARARPQDGGAAIGGAQALAAVADVPAAGGAGAASAGGAGSRGGSAGAGGAALEVGSAGGVQVSVWLRLRLLLPLLPTVRADREADPRKNLRACLAAALPHLLVSTYLRAQPAPGRGDVAAAAAAAAADAGHPLFQRVLLMLSAVLSGDWAGWLRGANKRLREVAAHEALAAACRAEVEGALQASGGGGPSALPLAAPGLVPAAGESQLGAEQLVRQLWLQQAGPAPAAGGPAPRKPAQQGLAGLHQRRALAALPLPGPPAQLPSAAAGWDAWARGAAAGAAPAVTLRGCARRRPQLVYTAPGEGE